MASEGSGKRLPEDAQVPMIWKANVTALRKNFMIGRIEFHFHADCTADLHAIQNNDTTMIEKIQTTIVNTIPLEKPDGAGFLGIAHPQKPHRHSGRLRILLMNFLRKMRKRASPGICGNRKGVPARYCRY